VFRDSGHEWIGQIPKSWRLVPSWSLFRRVKRTGHESEELLSVYRDYGVIPKSSRDDNHNVESDDLSSYQLVNPGDLVMNKMKAWQGSIALSSHRGIVSPAYFVFEPLQKTDSKYFHYLLRSKQYIGAYNRISKGVRIGQWDLDPVYFRTLPIVVPPLDEQQEIVSFLDEELLRIDQLIDTKINLVRSLQQRYNAYLCDVTTKGLNSAVEKNACGIEWAPNKPKHWVEVPFFTLGVEVSVKNRSMEENNLLSLSYGEIVQKDIETNEGLLPESFETYQIIDQGDLVFRFTDLQNDKKSLRSAHSTQRGIITSAYLAFRPKNCNPEFLSYQMRAWDLMKVFYAMGSGLRQSLKFSDVKRMPILLPPIDEQNAIVKALKAQHQVSQKLQTEVERAIELLKERRSTLISEAVTGKLTIRGTN
jgi:type I restriction enzyme S subunit